MYIEKVFKNVYKKFTENAQKSCNVKEMLEKLHKASKGPFWLKAYSTRNSRTSRGDVLGSLSRCPASYARSCNG